MQITSKKRAIATKFDWHGVGGPTVWFSVGGMGDDRIPVVVTQDEMHALATGTRKARLEVIVTMDDNAELTGSKQPGKGTV